MWEGIGSIFSEEMNEDLTKPISEEEITEGILCLEPSKRQVLMGFPNSSTITSGGLLKKELSMQLLVSSTVILR